MSIHTQMSDSRLMYLKDIYMKGKHTAHLHKPFLGEEIS